jgi:Plasmid pRiA4b ORF-3-like protein
MPAATERDMADPTTHILRATLAEDKGVYRDIEIPSARSLYDLAEAIISAFDFDFDHAFGFYSGLTERTMMETQPMYELFADIGEETEARSVEKTEIGEAFVKPGHKMVFLFDYGDEWLFYVELLGTGKKVARSRYPKILGSVGEAPEQYPAFDEEGFDDEDK